MCLCLLCFIFFFQAEDGIRDHCVTGVQTCALPISGEGFHPIGHPIRPRTRRPPPPCLHHFVGYPAKEEGISLREVLGRVTMQVFVRGYCTIIAAPVQCDVDGIPKGSHYVLLKWPNGSRLTSGLPARPRKDVGRTVTPARAQTLRFQKGITARQLQALVRRRATVCGTPLAPR